MAPLALRGCFTALVTPFTEDGAKVDFAALDQLVEGQIEGGVSGLVPCGTTGETPTLSPAEQLEVVRRVVTVGTRRVPVVAGTGTNATNQSIELSRAALDAGADAVMLVMPYYSKPSQEGLVRHVEAVAAAVSGPVILYNIPTRTGVDLQVSSLLRILESCKNVVGLKDASGNVLQCQALARSAPGFAVLSGDDGLTVPMMSVGATGVISVTANLYPRETSTVVRYMLDGELAKARAAHLRLMPVHEALFVEPSPAPIKAALSLRGRMGAALRLPLTPVSEETKARLRQAMDTFEARS